MHASVQVVVCLERVSSKEVLITVGSRDAERVVVIVLCGMVHTDVLVAAYNGVGASGHVSIQGDAAVVEVITGMVLLMIFISVFEIVVMTSSHWLCVSRLVVAFSIVEILLVEISVTFDSAVVMRN